MSHKLPLLFFFVCTSVVRLYTIQLYILAIISCTS